MRLFRRQLAQVSGCDQLIPAIPGADGTSILAHFLSILGTRVRNSDLVESSNLSQYIWFKIFAVSLSDLA